MATKRRPGEEDRRDAVRIALTGLATGRSLFDIADDLAALHPKNNTFPCEVLLGLAADALQESGATRVAPVSYEGIRERYLPECEFRGRNDHRKSHYALTAAAMIRAGVEPDLLGEVIWWSTDDFWLFAFYALVVYARVAADRTGLPVAAVCARIARRSTTSPYVPQIRRRLGRVGRHQRVDDRAGEERFRRRGVARAAAPRS